MILDGCFRLAYRFGYPLVRLWWRLRGGEAHGVAVVLRHRDRVLVLRESYRRTLGLPAGGIEAGETALEAARRELFEEVGIDLTPDMLRLIGRHSFRGDSRLIHDSIFEARPDAELPPHIDNREIVWAAWQPISVIASTAPLHPALAWYLERQAAGDINGTETGLR